jgi:hypothetical protein
MLVGEKNMKIGKSEVGKRKRKGRKGKKEKSRVKGFE